MTTNATATEINAQPAEVETTHDAIAVQHFCEFIRINTAHPNPDFAACLHFLRSQADELGLEYDVVYLTEDRKWPIVVMKWLAERRDVQESGGRACVMLNCHMDVVPVYPEQWRVDAFSGHVDPVTQDIYGRGTQDMKCVGVQYLEAIRRLQVTTAAVTGGVPVKPACDVILTWMPDEEIGGHIGGMAPFVRTEAFRALHVAVALDEGLANPTDKYSVFYNERCAWWLQVVCRGRTGHGSQFIQDTAAEKFHQLMGAMLKRRRSEEARLMHCEHEALSLGDVTTINLTMLEGGIQPNVVPDRLSATFDIRVTPSQDFAEFKREIAQLVHEICGDDAELNVLQDGLQVPSTDRNRATNPWWDVFCQVAEESGMQLEERVFPAATDGRYLREIGIPVIGFSPMNRTPILLHDHNERLNKHVFLRGIQFYERLIPRLCAQAAATPAQAK